MNSQCSIHQVQMTQRQSKTKFEEDGSPKVYFAHNLEKGLCFGKPPRDSQEQTSSTPYQATNSRSEEKDPEARGKSRCLVMCAVIQKEGLQFALDSQGKIELATSFIMNGPGTEEPEF